jgi:hypothetical protein
VVLTVGEVETISRGGAETLTGEMIDTRVRFFQALSAGKDGAIEQ